MTLPLLKPMLAVPSPPFSGDAWLFEVKWDGYRCLAYLDKDSTVLRSRNLLDFTSRFPELNRLHTQVRRRPAILDGEIVMPVRGSPSFSALQQRGRAADTVRIARAALERPALYIAFDLLHFSGRTIISETLEHRKNVLRDAVDSGPEVLVPDFVTGDGESLFAAAVQAGLEGVVGKRIDSCYQPGRRSPCWRKVRAVRNADLVICGWDEGEKRSLGALILGAFQGTRLVFQGKVGSGLTPAEETSLLEVLPGIEVEDALMDARGGRFRRPRWVKPVLVCTVQYTNLTGEGYLRHPVFKGLRWDKRPEECEGLIKQ